jgi:hypothetical protein
VTFDATVADYKKLAASIKERAAGRRYRLAFGDPAGLEEMRTAAVGPAVLARGPASSAPFYRITRLGERLLFLRGVPAPAEFDRPPTPIVNLGLVGGLISGFNAYAHAAARQKLEQINRQLEAADADQLVEIAHELDGSFVASPADVREIRLDPSGPFATQQVCRLTVRHAHLGELPFVVLSRDAVLTVVGDWAEVFGDVTQVHIAWSHSKCGFVAAE